MESGRVSNLAISLLFTFSLFSIVFAGDDEKIKENVHLINWGATGETEVTGRSWADNLSLSGGSFFTSLFIYAIFPALLMYMIVYVTYFFVTIRAHYLGLGKHFLMRKGESGEELFGFGVIEDHLDKSKEKYGGGNQH